MKRWGTEALGKQAVSPGTPLVRAHSDPAGGGVLKLSGLPTGEPLGKNPLLDGGLGG